MVSDRDRERERGREGERERGREGERERGREGERERGREGERERGRQGALAEQRCEVQRFMFLQRVLFLTVAVRPQGLGFWGYRGGFRV